MCFSEADYVLPADQEASSKPERYLAQRVIDVKNYGRIETPTQRCIMVLRLNHGSELFDPDPEGIRPGG